MTVWSTIMTITYKKAAAYYVQMAWLVNIVLTSGNLVREVRSPHGECAQLRSERSGFEPWPGTLCCVLGQDTSLSQCLSPPRYRRIVRETWQNCGGVTCDKLASGPGEIEILPVRSCYRNRDKLSKLWARLGSKASLSQVVTCPIQSLIVHNSPAILCCESLHLQRDFRPAFTSFSVT